MTTITFLTLPAELHLRIPKQVSTEILLMYRLSQVCRQLHPIYVQDLAKEAAKQLLKYVLHGQAAAAKKMMDANPRILLIQAEDQEAGGGMDVTGKLVPTKRKETPFQAITRAGDWRLLQHAVSCLRKIDNGIQLASASMTASFPSGFTFPPSGYSFDSLVNEITQDLTLLGTNEPGEETIKQLRLFRNYFLPSSTPSDKGYHFNVNHVLQAFRVFDAQWETWSTEQRSAFWRFVLGYLMRLVPAHIAQAFCQGLFRLIEQQQDLSRSLTLPNYAANKRFIWPALSELGITSGIEIYMGSIGVLPYMCLRVGFWTAALETYIAQIERELTSISDSCKSAPEPNQLPTNELTMG